MTDGGDRPTAPRADLQRVRDFWEATPCGEVYAQGQSPAERLEAQAHARYALEPCIRRFAGFEDGRHRDVLEIGVGMGADHLEWAKAAPRSLTGVDLTGQAIAVTRERLALHGLRSRLLVTDAERLPFADASFDFVYSWGVIHALRTRRPPSGRSRVSSGLSVGAGHHLPPPFARRLHAAAALRPPGRSALALARRDPRAAPREPGHQGLLPAQALQLFAGFSDVRVTSELGPGDLLLGAAGQRHRGPLLVVARRLYPRRAVRRLLPRCGLYLLIDATRPSGPGGGW